jgi:hypothetical protein
MIDLSYLKAEPDMEGDPNDLLWSIELEDGDDVTLTALYDDGEVRVGHGHYSGRYHKLLVNSIESLVVPVIESLDLPSGTVTILHWGKVWHRSQL